ncbi:methionyl-tRNA formyltransferase [Candidatus Wolfebacteria bacterium CG_4_9_14_3_um_filter_37_9]|uniref:Methionyl-tRNA formyltransferase n=1 Tax=Candidatus Wolfebacteria bacterium CG_4_9_14_3_um_filter_37_9 TaxID=1975065 RepID=A0A2M7X6E1_9BACT|nr:MAG: methionyl-tRNA formyltransferase [Candidatus Wolfebacteria bacterium CG_4_9_14_3_um_filter_37_9]
MRYIFFGTPKFAAIILEKLIKAGHIPSAVICNPDKPVGRKKIITAPEIKLIAQKYNIKVFQLKNLEIGNWKLEIDEIKPDFAIVAAYSQIIPKEILKIPQLGTIGVHPSLLPKYRGASPIQNAILNGDEITGTTLYLMDEKIDHGPILAKRELEFPISNFQFSKLYNALAELSADLLIETLPNIEEKIKNATMQNESQVTYTKKIAIKDAFIKPDDLEKAQNKGGKIALEIEQKIRALNPEPGTFTFINNKRVKILESKIVEGKLKLTKIQVEGKKPTLI